MLPFTNSLIFHFYFFKVILLYLILNFLERSLGQLQERAGTLPKKKDYGEALPKCQK